MRCFDAFILRYRVELVLSFSLVAAPIGAGDDKLFINKATHSTGDGMKGSSSNRLPILPLAALTLAALFLQGYHLGVDDAEVYIPAAKKAFNSQDICRSSAKSWLGRRG
jgi:hypothetical protein